MSSLFGTLPIAATILLASPGPPAGREVDNVAAFARLYGVVRFFYPSDAAAALDWNRFAVHGVSRARTARSAADLAAVLKELVDPLGPGLEVGARLAPPGPAVASSEPLVAWRYLGAGFMAGGGPYRAKRTHRASAGSIDGFITIMQSIPAEALRGRSIRLRAQVRARATAESGAGALWLRVDRRNHALGFFDNMSDRPIREAEWRAYEIEGPVADDAEGVAFGVMAMGQTTADFDAVELATKEVTGEWTPVTVVDAGFEAAEGAPGGWFRSGRGLESATVSRPIGGAPQGAQYLHIGPPPAGVNDEELFPEGAPSFGSHVDLDLGSGLKGRVPLTLSDEQAKEDPSRQAALARLRTSLAAVGGPGPTPDLDQRLADVVVAWSVFQHFYPYWSEASVDWNGRLLPRLTEAAAALTREAQHDALRGLVADARDGHGRVGDSLDKTERGELPVRLAVVEGRLLVVSTGVPSEAPVGAVIKSIDGLPAADWLAQAMRLVSGTMQWRRVAAIRGLGSGARGATVKVVVDDGQRPRETTLRYGEAPPEPKRPREIAELEAGLWYVDLTRVKMADLTPKLQALASARGVVFDLRGYPGDAGAGILPHLLAAPESDRWMHVAKIVGPFYQTAGWQDFGWDITPASPRITGKVVFLTDGGAISYAESVMGYVADAKLGTIVGSTTAGTNGNVATFMTPGGFNVALTGMRVTRHDGRSPFHLVGVVPDIAVAPTIAGLRAGGDEVLERAIEVVRAQASSTAVPAP
jgi:Peptidase family S41